MNLSKEFVEKKLIIKETLNIKLFLNCFVFVYFFLINLTYANENFIVTTVDKFPISKIDVTNKAKILLYSVEKTTDSNNLDKYYNEAINELINERVVFSEGFKINQKIEDLVTKKAESLLISDFNNSETQLNSFLKTLSIPKSALLEKYKTQLILGYIVKNKYKSQLINIEKLVDNKINSMKNKQKEDLFELAEIVFYKKNNSRLYEEIQAALKNGANFLNLARQISVSNSSKFDGKIGWKTYEEASRIIKTDKANLLEGDIFIFSTKDKFYFYKILVKRLKGKLSKKEKKVLLVEVKFPINFGEKKQVYLDVKKRLNNLLSDKSKCNNLLRLKKSTKFKISMNTIKSRIADLSLNIEYLINNLELFKVSKPLFLGNVGFAYIICDTQNAIDEDNNFIAMKNKMMNKHFLNLSNKVLQRLTKQAQITPIQKID